MDTQRRTGADWPAARSYLETTKIFANDRHLNGQNYVEFVSVFAVSTLKMSPDDRAAMQIAQ